MKHPDRVCDGKATGLRYFASKGSPEDAKASEGIDVPRWGCEYPREPTTISEIINFGYHLAKNVVHAHATESPGDRTQNLLGKLPSFIVAMESCKGVHF